jgi:hypothetical protein
LDLLTDFHNKEYVLSEQSQNFSLNNIFNDLL